MLLLECSNDPIDDDDDAKDGGAEGAHNCFSGTCWQYLRVLATSCASASCKALFLVTIIKPSSISLPRDLSPILLLPTNVIDAAAPRPPSLPLFTTSAQIPLLWKLQPSLRYLIVVTGSALDAAQLTSFAALIRSSEAPRLEAKM